MQGNWWNGTQHQRHEKDQSGAEIFGDVTPGKVSNGMCSL